MRTPEQIFTEIVDDGLARAVVSSEEMAAIKFEYFIFDELAYAPTFAGVPLVLENEVCAYCDHAPVKGASCPQCGAPKTTLLRT